MSTQITISWSDDIYQRTKLSDTEVLALTNADIGNTFDVYTCIIKVIKLFISWISLAFETIHQISE